ncbi:MAG: metallophosphatase family protein [Bacteroidales bacterium]|nr:metallophosphatase family protein [Bacteroidales bacterium]
MKKIGLISDTHGFIHTGIFDFLAEVDEIWHAGDIGKKGLIQEISNGKTVRAVFGNIDDQHTRQEFPEFQIFTVEEIKVAVLHIGGYPGRYTPKARQIIHDENPDIFISGHSHILKVMYDKKNKLLHLNPGAAGKSGLHKKITFMKFVIDGNDIKDMEIKEYPG